jgi:hypothetical protein
MLPILLGSSARTLAVISDHDGGRERAKLALGHPVPRTEV